MSFIPFSGRETCSVETQPKGVGLQDLLQESQVNVFKNLKMHQLGKDHSRPTKSNLGGKTHFGRRACAHEQPESHRDTSRAAALRRGCAHTIKV